MARLTKIPCVATLTAALVLAALLLFPFAAAAKRVHGLHWGKFITYPSFFYNFCWVPEYNLELLSDNQKIQHGGGVDILFEHNRWGEGGVQYTHLRFDLTTVPSSSGETTEIGALRTQADVGYLWPLGTRRFAVGGGALFGYAKQQSAIYRALAISPEIGARIIYDSDGEEYLFVRGSAIDVDINGTFKFQPWATIIGTYSFLFFYAQYQYVNTPKPMKFTGDLTWQANMYLAGIGINFEGLARFRRYGKPDTYRFSEDKEYY